jgi:hypothetical protein
VVFRPGPGTCLLLLLLLPRSHHSAFRNFDNIRCQYFQKDASRPGISDFYSLPQTQNPAGAGERGRTWGGSGGDGEARELHNADFAE